MSGMHDFLARAYDTNGASRESDMEKAAQAILLNKLAQEENVDLSGLTEDQLAMLAQEVAAQVASQQQGGQPGMGAPGGMPGGMPGMGGPPGGGMPGMGAPPPGGPPGGAPPMGAGPGKPAGGGPPQANIQPGGPGPQGAPSPGGAPGGGDQFSEEQIKVAQAKMAEADFLGRMMAHALVQEMGRIKTAQEGGSVFGMPPTGSVPPNPAPSSEKKEGEDEEEEAEKTAVAYLAARGYALSKTASAEGPLTRAIRALGGSVG